MTVSASSTSFVIQGKSLVAGQTASGGGSPFYGFDPRTGHKVEPVFLSATSEDIDAAVKAAADAAAPYAAISGRWRGKFLREIASHFDASADLLIEYAHAETALPRPRLAAEVARTSNQLRMFAEVVEEGSWVMARIDSANPARVPPKPDVRSMLRPLGPTVVFGASNFPLAFSVCGGDTASALAAGNPVIVKAHPAHPATSEISGRILAEAVQACDLPGGVFSLLFDSGFEVGSALVSHPNVCGVGFTGSYRGGRALMDLAAKRKQPIPVYAEMGSTNPVFILPGALDENAAELAAGIHASYTLGAGQFCTKPGMIFVQEENAAIFIEMLRQHTVSGPAFSMLTQGMSDTYEQKTRTRGHLQTHAGSASNGGWGAQPLLFETDIEQLRNDPSLAEEVFGPTTLLIHLHRESDMLEAARSFEGHLTATIFGTEQDIEQNRELLEILERKVGRIIINSFPTGVEVGHAMVHGGPYPATSDGRSTSVGSQAIYRFVRPVAFQGVPQSALPPALRDSNPEGLLRLCDGVWTGPQIK